MTYQQVSAQPAILTVDQAVEAVSRLLSGKKRQRRPVTPDTRIEDLGVDSLDIAELFVTLEEIAGVELDPDSAADVQTVADLVHVTRAST